MKKLVTSADQLAGLFVGLLGFVVAIGWILRSETIAQLIPGSARMGINTPVLFIAAGYCCYFALRGSRHGAAALAWRVAAALVVLLPALVLSQHVFNISLGIDFVRVPTAPSPGTPHPGRMAPNTCIAFILAGAGLHLARAARPGRARLLALGLCAGAAVLIGVTALAGYFLQLEAMYRIAATNVMQPPTALGIAMLGIGLWSLRAALRPPERDAISQEARITLRAFGVVAAVALSAGAAGFAALRDSYAESLSQSMMFVANTSADSIALTLAAGRRALDGLLASANLEEALAAAGGTPDAARLDAAARAIVRGGVDAVQFFGPRGEPLAAAGRFVPAGAGVRHPVLVGGQAATLLWNQGYLLRTEDEVRIGARRLGRVVAERRVPLLDQMLASVSAAGPADIVLCHRSGASVLCAPTPADPTPAGSPMSRADATLDLPITHALAGRSGVAMARDLRGRHVMAAYTPVRGTGLGLVVRNDAGTLYAPLRERANVLVLALALLVALGASALLLQVRPLLARLVREQRRTQVILENSNDAFVAVGVDGRITDWNTQAERMFGWSAAEAVGHDMATLIIPERLRRAHNQGFARYSRSGTGKLVNTRTEVRARRRDGSEIPVELSVAGFHNGDGYVANAFMRDITERLRLADEIAARAAELEQERDRAEAANRAKGEFVANMSHELRTPMNAVLGMTYLLGHTELKDEQRKYLDMIRDSGRSLLGIMNDVLDFSKVEAGRMELEEARFLLSDVLGAVATIMSVNAGDKDLELAIDVDPAVPQVLRGDAVRLQQVLVNLAGNAIKFTEQGEVVVMVDLAGREGGRATLRVRVRDTGIGIDEAQQARIFSPFTQGDSSTTRRFGGTGLGLTISRRLVRLMGGDMSFESAAGQGTEFCFTVPLGVEAERDDSRAASGAMGGLRLLVADDNATSRNCLVRAAEGCGWTAAGAESGEQALALVRAGAPRFDLVVLDWQMPGMDGLRAMEAIRNASGRGQMPVALMVNAYDRARVMASPLASRVDAILGKPVTAAALFDALHQVFPRRALGAHGGGGRAPAVALARLDGARLLLAEDNELNQAVARGILEQAGARVDIVANGELAVARLAAAPGAYDLVLMDIQMPVMDGFAATRQIRGALGLSLPILAITAGVTEAERASYMAAGMNGLVPKPVEVDQMVAAIAHWLNRRRRSGAPPPVAAGAAPALDAAPVLDVAPLVAIARGDPERLGAVAKLLERVVADCGAEFAQARLAWAQGEPEAAARMLHGLRGGVGSIGAKRFAQASLELEQSVKSGQRAQAERLFAAAQAELDAALTAAQDWLAAHRAGAGA